MKGQTLIDSLSINPNPFQNRTSLTYSFINNDTVSINIYDVIGNIIFSPITNSVMPSGVYQDSLIMDSYADGIYFVQLKLSHRKTIIRKIAKSNTAGISINATNLKDLKAYPNPIKDKLNIEFTIRETENIKLKLYSSQSQLVYSIYKLKTKQEIDLSFLANGIYYLKVENNSEQKVFKIIKE